MTRALLILAGTLLLGLVWPAAALVTGVLERPEVAVRGRPLHAHAGRLSRAAPIGQGFRCAADGLWRIDVRAVAPRSLDAGPVELRVRLDAPDGAIVRTVAASPAEANGTWLEIPFEPLADTAGRDVYFELVPGLEGEDEVHPLRPWLRPRAQAGEGRPWGDDAATGAGDTRLALALRPELPDLSAIAVAVERLEPGARIALDLHAPGEPHALRHAEVTGLDVRQGYVLLPFHPLAESYAADLRVELQLSAGATVRVHAGEPSVRAYHGRLDLGGAPLGTTRAGVVDDDADLVFRAWTRPTARETLATLHARLGWRLPVAAALWIACVALALSLATARTRPERAVAAALPAR